MSKDRPDREKITRRAKALTEEGCWIDKDALEQVFICPNMDCFECFSQHGVIALFPDIEELDKIRTEIFELSKKLDDREKDLIEAKREERERIRMAFWEVFKGAGEVWFPYPPSGSEEECEGEVQIYWDELLQALKEANNVQEPNNQTTQESNPGRA